jgi:hypothetical protein
MSEVKFMFKVSFVDFNVSLVKTEKVTEHFLFVDGKRIAKRTKWEAYFENLKDAVEFAEMRLEHWATDLADKAVRLKHQSQELRYAAIAARSVASFIESSGDDIPTSVLEKLAERKDGIYNYGYVDYHELDRRCDDERIDRLNKEIIRDQSGVYGTDPIG